MRAATFPRSLRRGGLPLLQNVSRKIRPREYGQSRARGITRTVSDGSFGAYTIGDDSAMMPVITSADIACGLHGGDPLVMERIVRPARETRPAAIARRAVQMVSQGTVDTVDGGELRLVPDTLLGRWFS